MGADEKGLLGVYVGLARAFIEAAVPIPELEQQFFETWGNDKVMWDEDTFRVLERFFFIVEDYVHDDPLRDPREGDLDADQLRAGARRFLEELSAL